MNLNKLLKPRTIAIVGASEKAGFGGDTDSKHLKLSKNIVKAVDTESENSYHKVSVTGHSRE